MQYDIPLDPMLYEWVDKEDLKRLRLFYANPNDMLDPLDDMEMREAYKA